MSPARDDYATQEEWLRAVAEWNEAVPSDDNDKMFMVFSGEATPDKFLFEGTFWEFKNCFFEAYGWADVETWAKDEGNLLLLEGTDEYNAASEMLDLAEVEEVQDEAIGGKTKFGAIGLGSEWMDS
jgi:hypothetical protein